MHISASDAKGQFTDPVPTDPAGRRALQEKLRLAARAKATTGPKAAHSQDFLYGDDGMPGT